MTLSYFLMRECLILLAGVVISLGVSLIGRGDLEIKQFGAAIILSIAFCLYRASLARPPRADVSPMRRFAAQVVLALALLLLMIFEMGIAIIADVFRVPAVVWLIFTSFGLAYLGTIALSHALGGHAAPSTE